MNCWQGEKGNVMIIFALALTALLGIGAIVVDVGLLYSARVHLVNTADAAALAGAALLPGDSEAAIVEAENIAQQNGVGNNDCDVEISEDNSTITVVTNRQVNFSFARIFGLTSQNVSARAVARVTALSSATGVIPFGIERQDFIFGQMYHLKEGGGSGYDGNYGALALGGNGATIYKYNIINGYNGTVHVGDWVSTETGNMSGPTETGVEHRIHQCTNGCTYDNYEKNCSRVVTIPIIDSLAVNGRKDVQVVGFASFFLEGVGGSGNENYVEGRFLQELADGEGSGNAPDFGLRSVKLIE